MDGCPPCHSPSISKTAHTHTHTYTNIHTPPARTSKSQTIILFIDGLVVDFYLTSSPSPLQSSCHHHHSYQVLSFVLYFWRKHHRHHHRRYHQMIWHPHFSRDVFYPRIRISRLFSVCYWWSSSIFVLDRLFSLVCFDVMMMMMGLLR